MNEVRWVRQDDAYGCGPAALAMITGKTYAEVKAYLYDKIGETLIQRGTNQHFAYDYLVTHGYAWAVKQLGWFGHERAAWPCEPFGDLHLCEVVVGDQSGGGHWVVMLRDGTVLDPLTPEPRRLTDYLVVDFVAAVVPFRVP